MGLCRKLRPQQGHRGGKLLAQLVSHDDWLPDEFAQPNPERYQQFLLYADPDDRFSVVSFVWGPGQATPIHDHTVWGLVGVLRGAVEPLGFVCHPLRFEEDGTDPIDNLYARWGTGGRHFCFAGHSDVVPVDGQPSLCESDIARIAAARRMPSSGARLEPA